MLLPCPHIVLLAIALLSISPYSKAKAVLVVGDSLSAAYGFDISLGWVNLLQQKLNTARPDEKWRVINASVSGETTSGGRARLPALLKQHKPDICIIALGANDGLRGQPIQNIRSNLRFMIERCHQHSAQTILVGMQLPPNYGPRYVDAFRQCYTTLAKQYKLPLVPFLLAGFADQPAFFQADGLHPTSKAQPLIINNVWPVLRQFLLEIKDSG